MRAVIETSDTPATADAAVWDDLKRALAALDTALAPAARTAESALQAANAAGIEVPQLMRLVLDIHHILRELLDDGTGLPAAIPVEAGATAPQGQQT